MTIMDETASSPTPALDLLPPPQPGTDLPATTEPGTDVPKAPTKLPDGELADLCGLLYEDAFNGLGSLYVGRPVELPDKRASKRGKQLAVALKALGWDDGQVILIVGLCSGLASDVALLHQLKLEGPASPGGKA